MLVATEFFKKVIYRTVKLPCFVLRLNAWLECRTKGAKPKRNRLDMTLYADRRYETFRR
ncbi:hypothetical protein SCH4B_0229 [Ruegeria sp. TrichCH4B]|nr:hypothetical protein SCH4B_0229 [Ruegeria sp. TrichCH4B]